ncbi:MAG: molybdenum cofactor guanylyltransferase [Ignavibacteriae bacterium]|nr:MAG: molybdenum cofactor guanylyltransferase [Ignavibacteriota bacterium]
MYNNITGIILAGGKSLRMGTNKALLPFRDTTIIEYIAGIMKSLFKNVIIITNSPEEYEFIDLKKFEDIISQKGPLSGIHSGLTYSNTDKNFIISCDIPLITPELISYIIEYPTKKPITVVKADGFVQQLCGVYDKSCLTNANELLLKLDENSTGKSKCKVLALIENIGAEIINSEAIPCYKDGMFLNINRIEDYKKAFNVPNNYY